MLEQLASNNVVNGWNIYQNKTGHVCLNIKFDVDRDIPGDMLIDEQSNLNTQYRRVSPKQQARNVQRIHDYQQSITNQSKSKPVAVKECVLSERSVVSSSVQVGSGVVQCLDSSTQVILHKEDTSVQVVPKYISKKVQASILKRHKSTHVGTKCVDDSVQVDNELIPCYDHAVQTHFSSVNTSVQAGPGLHQQVDTSSQVTPDLVVAAETKASQVTADLAENFTNIHKHTQTPFLCPGNEEDPGYDLFVLNRPCNNSACRYASSRSKPCRGALFMCNICDIVMCGNCKEESVHDEICEERLKFHRVGFS
jgi:hypothetical protein